MKLLVLSIVFSLLKCMKIVVVKGDCSGSPYNICENASKVGVVATPYNLNDLTKVIKECGVPSAYVYGWNDHKAVYVLRQDGNLTPYDKYTNKSEYALCMLPCKCIPSPVECSPTPTQKPCPPDSRHHHKAHRPASSNQKPSFHTQGPTTSDQKPYIQTQRPCCSYLEPSSQTQKPYCPPPKPCHDQSESSSSDSREEMCPIFVKQKRRTCRNKNKCNDKRLPDCTREIVNSLKTFVFSCEDGENFRLNAFSECNVMKNETYNIHKRGSAYKNLPAVLNKPKFLYFVKCNLEKKYRMKVCLYVTDCNNLYVFKENTMFHVITKHKEYKLVKISGSELEKLAKKGLYGVEFQE